MSYMRDGITFRTCLIAEEWYLEFYHEKQERWVAWPGGFGASHGNALNALPRCAAIIKDCSYEVGYAHPPRGAAEAREIKIGANNEGCVQLLQQHGGGGCATLGQKHGGWHLHTLRRRGGATKAVAPEEEKEGRRT